MLRKLAAVSIAVVWLFLFAVDMAEDSGLIPESGAEADQSIDTVLADFGKAIKIFPDSQAAVSAAWGHASVAAYLILFGQPGVPSILSVSLQRGSQETALLKKHPRLHELYQVFLI